MSLFATVSYCLFLHHAFERPVFHSWACKINCDPARENKAYVHIKFDYFFDFKIT